jgi:hypothetical protein
MSILLLVTDLSNGCLELKRVFKEIVIKGYGA